MDKKKALVTELVMKHLLPISLSTQHLMSNRMGGHLGAFQETLSTPRQAAGSSG